MIKIIRRFLGFFTRRDCYYLNSNNILPPPLEEDVERDLLNKSKEGDIEARNTLIIHNLRLVVFIAKKFESTKINLEDLSWYKIPNTDEAKLYYCDGDYAYCKKNNNYYILKKECLF